MSTIIIINIVIIISSSRSNTANIYLSGSMVQCRTCDTAYYKMQ